MPVITELHDTRFPGPIDADITRWIDPTVPPTGADDLKSIALDGSTEYFANTTGQSYGIGDVWTWALWVKVDNLTQSHSFLMMDNAANDNNQIRIFYNNGSNFIVFIVADSSGTRIKNYNIPTTSLTENGWTLLTATWDGPTDTWLIYADGFAVTPTKNQDDSGTMDNGNNEIEIGGPDAGQHISGYIHSTAFWNVALTAAEIEDLWNTGDQFDWSFDSGAYSSSANIEHYWRHGFNDAELGEDSGVGTPINIADNASNITVDDIVDDYPGM